MDESVPVQIWRKWHTDLLRSNPDVAVDYVQAAIESLASPMDLSRGLVALRFVADANGGLTTLAELSGVRREVLHRALCPHGNPTLRTLIAVLKAMGLRLSVTPAGAAGAGAPS